MTQKSYPLIKVDLKRTSDGANYEPYGSFCIQFLDDYLPYRVAPMTAKHMIRLVETGFYDNIFVHRIIPGTIVQMGCPKTRDQPDLKYYGTGNCGRFIRLESTTEPNAIGSVGMARGEELNSGSSQFYITLKREPKLDGKYVVWGQVVQGLDTLMELSKIPPWEEKDSYKQIYNRPGAPRSPIPPGLSRQIPSQAIAMYTSLIDGEEKDAIIKEYVKTLEIRTSEDKVQMESYQNYFDAKNKNRNNTWVGKQ